MSAPINAPGPTRWHWVRHAPVVGQKGVIYGNRDVSCDLSQRSSFQALARILPGKAVWLTSHLSRAKETASAIARQGFNIPAPIIEKDLAEQDFGDWQGKAWDDFNMETDTAYREFWRDPAENAPQGGESFADVFMRVSAVIKRFNAAHSGAQIVVVAHGGPIRAAVALALGLELNKALCVKIDPLSLTKLDFFAAEGQHVSHGVHAGSAGAWRIGGVNSN